MASTKLRVCMKINRRARLCLWLGRLFLSWASWVLKGAGVPLKRLNVKGAK